MNNCIALKHYGSAAARRLGKLQIVGDALGRRGEQQQQRAQTLPSQIAVDKEQRLSGAELRSGWLPRGRRRGLRGAPTAPPSGPRVSVVCLLTAVEWGSASRHTIT